MKTTRTSVSIAQTTMRIYRQHIPHGKRNKYINQVLMRDAYELNRDGRRHILQILEYAPDEDSPDG